MFIASILLTLFALYSIQFVPSMPKHTRVTLTCDKGSIDIRYCPRHLDFCEAKNYIRLPDTTTNNSMRSLEFDVSIRYRGLQLLGVLLSPIHNVALSSNLKVYRLYTMFLVTFHIAIYSTFLLEVRCHCGILWRSSNLTNLKTNFQLKVL